MSEENDFELIRRCLEGDNKSFEVLVERYQKPIFNVALKMVNDAQDAEDLTQIVFIKAYENLKKFDPNYKFFNWIYRMVINESLNWIKRKKRFTALDSNFLTSDRSPEKIYHETELSQNIGRALLCLKPENRAMIILKHFHGFSYHEISYILEIPEKTVKSRLFSARHRIKDILIKQGVVKND